MCSEQSFCIVGCHLLAPSIQVGLCWSEREVLQGDFDPIEGFVDVLDGMRGRNPLVTACQFAIAVEVDPSSGAGSHKFCCHGAIVFQSIGEMPDFFGEPEEYSKPCA